MVERMSRQFAKTIEDQLSAFSKEKEAFIARCEKIADIIITDNSDPSMVLNQLQNEIFQFAWEELKKDSSEATLEVQQQATKINNFMDTNALAHTEDGKRTHEMLQAVTEKYEKLAFDFAKV